MADPSSQTNEIRQLPIIYTEKIKSIASNNNVPKKTKLIVTIPICLSGISLLFLKFMGFIIPTIVIPIFGAIILALTWGTTYYYTGKELRKIRSWLVDELKKLSEDEMIRILSGIEKEERKLVLAVLEEKNPALAQKTIKHLASSEHKQIPESTE